MASLFSFLLCIGFKWSWFFVILKDNLLIERCNIYLCFYFKNEGKYQLSIIEVSELVIGKR